MRNVDDPLHERGIDVSHETGWFRWKRFSLKFAAEIRSSMRSRRHLQWRLDEVNVKITAVARYVWPVVDHRGEVLESVVRKIRDRKAALGFVTKTVKQHGRPEANVTDRLWFCGAALKNVRRGADRDMGQWPNDRAENSHLPFRRRERAMLRFRRVRTLHTFASVHANVFNHFPTERHPSKPCPLRADPRRRFAKCRGLFAA